jgi:Enoyl-CoA hydratase/isomerase
MAYGLADVKVSSTTLASLWESLATRSIEAVNTVGNDKIAINSIALQAINTAVTDRINIHFSLSTVAEILSSLDACNEPWAQQTATTLRSRSPLMLHVVLEQIRRGRKLNLAQNLQMERSMVRHCFFTKHLGRFGNASETVEGIRALAVDKDHHPHWNPATIDAVTNDMVAPFFVSPWPAHAHPLVHLTSI